MIINCTSGSQNLFRQKHWDYICVTEYHQNIGLISYPQSSDHQLFIMLANQPALLSRTIGEETVYGVYREGDVALLPAGQTMCEQWESTGHCLQIQISSHLVQQLLQEAIGAATDLQLFPVLKLQNSELLSIGKMLLAATNQEHPGEARYMMILTELLTMHLVRGYATQNPIPEPRIGLAKHQVEIIKHYINEHLRSEIRLPDLAEVLGMSHFHFSRIFKQTMDISPYQYVIRQRVERVKTLLQQQQLSLTDVALETGFNSQSHMGTCFKQMTGMTPNAYRSYCHTTRAMKRRDFDYQQLRVGS